jgi:isoleucyl-tRNA synthetase
MYLIADGLVRLLAPILPMTADELWRHLPGQREVSVHIAEFPPTESLDAMIDADLADRWERLKAIRDMVNVALEAKRQDKTIGTSLGARVTLRAGGDNLVLLARYLDDLPMLFIVSQVAVETSGSEGDTVHVQVDRAEGKKCVRCWRVVDAISRDTGTEGLCERCLGAVATTA